MAKLDYLDPYNSVFTSNELPILPIAQVIALKAQIEGKLDQLTTHLVHDLKSNMDESLVTGDGFPRADDVVDVRYTRIAIIKYRNDLKEVMDVLASRLDEVFTSTAGKKNKSDGDVGEVKQPSIPFAQINHIKVDSAAHTAGLRINDKIVSFGSVNVTNHDNLKALKGVIDQRVPFVVQVQRDDGETVKCVVNVDAEGLGMGIVLV